MSKTLEDLLSTLAETLEDQPDPWYNNPKGFLKKPDFKRAAQDIATLNRPSMLNTIVGSPYNIRWFVLDMQTKMLRYYKDDKPTTTESGRIDIHEIVDVQLSKVYDAPEFSLDLISKEKHYTVVAESHAAMVRWAFAFNLARGITIKPKTTPKITPHRRSVMLQKQKFEENPDAIVEYSVQFAEPGPLMLNVMGTVDRDRDGNVVNNQILVTSFESNPDGKPGRAEKSGKISVRDFLIGVNEVDLKKLNFNDAMDAIISATWPKTLHFLRDPTISREASQIESWALVYYPSLNRRRRRYIDLKRNVISFRKPAPGGSASSKRDAFFLVDQIIQIRPIVDKTVPSDQQFTLQLLCKPKATISHVDEEDVSIGGSPVDIIELCFPKQQHMNSWRSALISPTADPNGKSRPESNIFSLPVETIEAADVTSIATVNKIGIKNDLTSNFYIREFSLHEGYLKWKRVGQSKNSKTAKLSKGRSLFIANSTLCSLKQLIMQEDSTEQRNGFKYQLVLETTDASITMGMKDEVTLKQWVTAIREVIAVAPAEQQSKAVIGQTIKKAKAKQSNGDGANEDEEDGSRSSLVGQGLDDKPSTPTSSSLVQGYLYKKGEKLALGMGSENFKKRWFVLKNFELLYFRSPGESSNIALALGAMDLRTALEIREAVDASSPENALEIVTPNRVYVLVAEDEEEQLKWVDALADKLEERKVAVQREGNNENVSNDTIVRKELMLKSIVYSGMLAKKTVNPVTQGSVYWDRFFVIANASFSYYHTEEEFYDEDKNAIADIPLVNITNVCTSGDSNSSFEVTMRTRRGGDANGIRVYTLQAIDEIKCLSWMTEICAAVGTLDLNPLGDGKYQSVVNAEALKQREKNRVQATFFKPEAAQNIKKAAGVTEKMEETEDFLTEEEKHARSLLAMDRRANPNLMVMTGRGGRGNSTMKLAPYNPEANTSIRDSFSARSNSFSFVGGSSPTGRNSFAAPPSAVTNSPKERSVSTSDFMLPPTPTSSSKAKQRNSQVFLGAGRGNRSALRSSLDGGSSSPVTTPANSDKSPLLEKSQFEQAPSSS